MALPSDFETHLESFKEKLDSNDLEDFKNTTVDEMLRNILQIQSKQVSDRNNRDLTRLEKFLSSLQCYSNVIQRLSQRNDIVAYIYGPIKFLLKKTSTHNKAFDELIIAYKEIGDGLPHLADADRLFHAQPHMKLILSNVYKNLHEFHSILLDYFKQPHWENDFEETWKRRRERFTRQINRIAQDKTLLENQASPSEIEESRSRIEMAQQEANARFEKEEQRQLKIIFDWFKASDVDVDHHYSCKLREEYPGTGRWLLKNAVFSQWFNQYFPPIPPLLWIKGMPGSGKTVLASLVIKEAQKLRDPTPTVLYFFCRQDNQERNNLMSILRTFLKQLLQQNSSLLTAFYSQCCHSGENTLSSPDLAKDLLNFALEKCKSIYIILDGLDECPRKQRQQISQLFRTIVEDLPISDPERIRCLFISQDDGAARKDLHGLMSIDISNTDNIDDIKKYCDIEAGKLKDIFRFTDEKASEIANHVSQSAGGMFLLAKLIWNNLEAQNSMARLEDELRPDRFPKEINSAYERIISRMTQDGLELPGDILRLLGRLVCAKRPLKWYEIQGMQSIDLNNRSMDFHNNGFAKSAKELCASLIEERDDGTVELVHLTAKSFLVEKKHIDLPTEELNLSRLCVDYLNLPIFTQQPTEENILLGDYSFMDYAVLFWLPHLEAGAISRSVSHDIQMSELQESLGVFIGRHLKLNETRLTLAKRHSDKMEFFKNAPFYDQLEQAVASTKQHLKHNVQPEKLVLDLYDIVIKVRKVLEQTCSSATDESFWVGFEEKYGSKDHLFKCERFNCQFFTVGFSTSYARDEHLKKHVRPFRCADINCHGFAVGFVTANLRDAHLERVHSTQNRADRDFPTLEDVQRSIQDQSTGAERVENVIAPDTGEGPRADEAVVDMDEASESEDDRIRPRQKRLRQTEFNCPHCDKKFSRKYNMESHLITHETERRYACGRCDKRFARESDLTRHENTHSGRREHLCRGLLGDGTRWGCGKAFARAETLRKHHQSTMGKLCIAPALLQRQRDSDQSQTPANMSQ